MPAGAQGGLHLDEACRGGLGDGLRGHVVAYYGAHHPSQYSVPPKMKLTDTKVRSTPRERLYKLFDGHGLYIEIHPNNARYWRLKYRHSGKERRLALGVYPQVSLAEARNTAAQARKYSD